MDEPILKIPPHPVELWMLVRTGSGDYMLALDDPRGHDVFLCCFSEVAAIATVKHQKDLYDVDCVPMRIIP